MFLPIIKVVNGRRGGFTLMELLIVIIVIAVLAAIAIPKFIDSGARSKEAALKTNLKLYRDGIERFRNDTGLYPANLPDLADTEAPNKGLTTDGDAAALPPASWRGPYIERIVDDPVSGEPFTYSNKRSDPGTVLSSANGKDSAGVKFKDY